MITRRPGFRWVAASLVLAALGASAAAAGPRPEPRGPEEDAPAPAGEAAERTPDGVVVLRLKTVAPRASPWGELLTSVARRTKKQSAGKIEVQLRWEQKSEAALVRQCASGKTDGIAVSIGALAAVVPELDAFELPFLFDGYADADRAFAASGALVAELLAKKGFVYGLRGENGFRHFAAKGGFIVTPDDLAGRTMRSQPSAVHKAVWLALGAVPKELQVADVPESLESGVVAGYDNTLLFGRLAEWSRHVGFVTLSAHAYQGALVVWCKPWFDALTPELQAVMTRPDPKLEASGLKLVRLFNDKLMPAQYEAEGTRLRALSADERSAFEARLAGVVTAFVAGTSADGKRLVALLQKAAGR